MSSILTYLNGQQAHETYLPVALLTVIHAVRVTIVWFQACKGKDRRQASFLQGLLGYLTLAWGGSSMVSVLLSQPPSWLLSPMPWLVYVSTYVLFHSTGVSSLLAKIPPTVLTLVDAATRSSGIAALPTLIAASGIPNNWWTHVILSGIAVSGGGWIAGAFGMTNPQWSLKTPAALKGGLWATMDVWSGMLVAVVFGAVGEAYPEYKRISWLTSRISKSLLMDAASQKVSAETARAAGAMLLVGLLSARVLLA